MSEKHRIASVSDIPEQNGLEVTVAGKVIGLFLVDGEVFAIDGLCPHAGGPVGKGYICGSMVTCPWHGWQFDVKTGQHSMSPNMSIAKYDVTVEDGEIWIEL